VAGCAAMGWTRRGVGACSALLPRRLTVARAAAPAALGFGVCFDPLRRLTVRLKDLEP